VNTSASTNPVTLRQDDRLAFRPASAAAAIGISRSQLYEEIKAGRIRVAKCGVATLIPRAELEAWLARHMDDESYAVAAT
jgi:excisionase family DNA binding protein